ncbi:MAG: hypothetical protein JNL40_15685 [Cyclobacteriaceae bacterium]|nr:hypothetical protein [Cyclobacteriaceae bacterium]
MKEFFVDGEKVEMKPIKGKKYFIPVDSISRIHVLNDETTFVLRKRRNEFGVSWDKFEVLEEGPLTLLSELVPYSNTASSRVLYLDQGDVLKNILYSSNTIFQGKSNRTEELKKIVRDDADLVSQLSQEDFKLNEASVKRIIRLYNVARWKKPGDQEPRATFYLYLKANGKFPTTATVSVNDEEPIEVYSTKGIMVNVPAVSPSKVCLGNYCQAILPNPYFSRYFEIQKEEDPVVFEPVESDKAKRELQYRYQKSIMR